MLDQARKDKEKSDKSIEDAKSSAKAATWMDRAKTYENIALQFTQLDSNAAQTAYEAYKKVVELDVTKKGEAGRSAKEAQKILAAEEGTNLYNAFVKQGAEMYQNKNMNGALKMFQTAQEINPKDTLSALYGGIAAQQIDKKEEAAAQFEKYVANGGKDPSVFYGLAQLYRTNNNTDKAISTLNKGLERSPDNKDLKAEIVNILLASGKEDEAINQLKELVAKEPNNVQNLVNLAILYDNSNIKLTNQIREAEEKLGATTSKGAGLQKQLEDEKGKMEVFDSEIKRLSARIKAQPKNADLKRQLDQVTQSRNEAKQAIAKLETDVKSASDASANVDKSKLETDLTDMKAKQKSLRDMATSAYVKALEVDPSNYDALFNLGVFYFNEAVEMKREVDNMNMQEYQQRGKAVESKVCGQFKKAQPYFQKAVQVNAESEAKDTLETLNNILAQFEGKQVQCVTE
ncbi:tetratricopeptide repeat protein [Telluribacter sp.]|uniref:tetratricopeptide repeat protein n=1 Tax=Telluribacter sp. TaxID=1978767 RepID=UPI002E146F38|nr:tetratricopeptide repeat protein [Telluribacter sp.]